MPFSLGQLASKLDNDQYNNLKEFYKVDEVFKLTRRKGVYQYEYTDSWEKFEETKLLPKSKFYS